MTGPMRRAAALLARRPLRHSKVTDFGSCDWERNGVPGVCKTAATIRYRAGKKVLLKVCVRHERWALRELGAKATHVTRGGAS